MHDHTTTRRHWRTPLTAAALAAATLVAPSVATAKPTKPATTPACKPGEIKKVTTKAGGKEIVKTYVCDKAGKWIRVVSLAPSLQTPIGAAEPVATPSQKPTGGGPKVTCEVVPGVNADVGETMTVTQYTKDENGKVQSINRFTFRCGADGEWHAELRAPSAPLAPTTVIGTTGAKS